MKPNHLYFIAAISPILTLAAAGQAPPPAADVTAPQSSLPTAQLQAGTPARHSSRVSAVVYGPQGEVEAITLRDGAAVALTPELGMRVQSSVTKGTPVQVSGMQRVISGQTSLIAQSLSANGQTFVATTPVPDPSVGRAGGMLPPPPAPLAGPPDPRDPRIGRGPGAPPPPPPPAGFAAPPPPDGSAPPPPPPGTPPPNPPQM